MVRAAGQEPVCPALFTLRAVMRSSQKPLVILSQGKFHTPSIFNLRLNIVLGLQINFYLNESKIESTWFVKCFYLDSWPKASVRDFVDLSLQAN